MTGMKTSAAQISMGVTGFTGYLNEKAPRNAGLYFNTLGHYKPG
jgi:hypothetical protein